MNNYIIFTEHPDEIQIFCKSVKIEVIEVFGHYLGTFIRIKSSLADIYFIKEKYADIIEETHEIEQFY